MMAKRADGLLRAFGMTTYQISEELSSIEREFGIELGHLPQKRVGRKVSEYEQFEAKFRAEAAKMSEIYEVFFCLENSIRSLVTNILSEEEGVDWWASNRIDDARIRKPCDERRNKEIDHAVTPRSDELIDYTTFGELSQIIIDNWDLFDTIFRSKKAVSSVTNHLNLLRGPIAHCNPTDEFEQERLNLAVKSWFKIMS